MNHVLTLLLLLVLSCKGSSALDSAISSTKNDNEQVHEAIKICREKLAIDPHFPKVQHSLALLLDSQIDIHQPDIKQVYEVIQLYNAVGKPSKVDLDSKRVPPFSIRFRSLCRAAAISHEVLHETSNAVRYYIAAMELDGGDCENLVILFEIVMPMILASMIEGSGGDVAVSSLGAIQLNLKQKHIQMALDLCHLVGSWCPDEPLVDEYRGATLRKLKQTGPVYESYLQAAFKSRQLYLESAAQSSPIASMHEHLSLLRNYIKRSVLVSAAGRESGISPGEQMSYLTEAEAHIETLLQDNIEVDENTFEAGKDVVVDLYNNMGIIEKKRGASSEARIFFMKALEIRSNDGHALVQLASLEDGKSSEATDIVANAKGLDPEYIEALFDGYSTRFESELVNFLNYKGHHLLHDAVKKIWDEIGSIDSKATTDKVIDLGCGTGLLGELIANDMPMAEIHGVDISKRMTEISRERRSTSGKNVYSTVVKGDVAESMSSFQYQSVDWIVASDVFIYVGDLDQVLRESARCLSTHGIVAFTTESYKSDDTGGVDTGLKLLPSGRFGHSKGYIDAVASATGFEVVTWQNCVLRQQGGEDVNGAVVVLKKSPLV